ncbi:hypothetical protein CI238_12244 [Colletotrichum incanum]|uniref:Uncharacterized protein n=1 Tax=Colletotrichum incanum TaxID=1573173 RepID=A0A167ACV3_COLIC|nr:hypothetical protein CI238_12244 [Colletotrichum incanum]OHW95004.1 hypothetical protein CSPAE12_06274 [Colletotrichum incanum]
MANSKPADTDSAEALHGLLNDVLIQTGKALRSQSKEGRSQVQAQISLQTKIPELIDTFHWNLDDLESEIMRAKAALQRDLDRFRQERQPVEQPAPIEAQTKSPIAIDLDSSSREVSPENKTEVTEATGPHRVPAESSAAPSMAPFPDMGVSFQPQPEPAQPVKQETTPAPPAMMAPMSEVKSESKPTPPASQPQPSGAPEAPMDDLFGLGGSGGGEGGDAGGGDEANDSEFHFTDMTFSLAPPNNDSQPQPRAQEAPMDMSFGSGDMGGDLLSLDNLLPPDNNAAKQEPGPGAAPAPPATTAAAAAAAPPAAADQQKPAEAKMEKQDSSLDDLFALDGNTGMDDMDLDMNMGGEGGEGNNFDDMMFFDDTEMEHGKFDEDFFQIQ